jgi:hypothetical protein
MGATTLPETFISGRRVRKQPFRLSASPPASAITASPAGPQQLCAGIMAKRFAKGFSAGNCCLTVQKRTITAHKPGWLLIFEPVAGGGHAA